ncbi:hypothetical protein DPMN_128867, partial [Dreissena polymorpha]
SQKNEEIVITAGLKQPNTCTIDNIRLLEGASIRLHRKTWQVYKAHTYIYERASFWEKWTYCIRCKRGYLSCKRIKRKNSVDVKPKSRSRSSKKRDKKNDKRRRNNL